MEIRTVFDVKIIMIIPRIDASNAKTVETQLAELVNGGITKIVCNFTENKYISRAGLRGFLSTWKMLIKIGEKIVLLALQPYVQEDLRWLYLVNYSRFMGQKKKLEFNSVAAV